MKTSVYLNRFLVELVGKVGNPPLTTLIQEGAEARLKASGRASELEPLREARAAACKHPSGRVHKGLCMACGTNVSS